MRLKPGDPLPPDLPPDAQRYRMVREERFRDRGPMALGIVVAMVACGVCLSLLGVPYGFVVASFALAFVAMWWAHEDPPMVRYVPDDRGEYVVEPHSMVAERLGALAAPEKLSAGGRVFCGAVGAAMLLLALLDFYDNLRKSIEFDAVELIPLVLGVVLVYLAVSGEHPSLETGEVPASPRFRELADPSRPLPDDAPISGRR